MEIQESGMKFMLADDNCFLIEKHRLGNTNCGHSTRNNKVCEFVTFLNSRFVFVEAKSSAPKRAVGKVADLQLNGQPIPTNWIAFDNYISYLHNIAQKFIDSFGILNAISLGRHGEEEINDINLPQVVPAPTEIEFVLILNLPQSAGNVVRESLSPLKEALTNEMRPFLKTWNISTCSVKIFWPEEAQSRYNFLPEISHIRDTEV